MPADESERRIRTFAPFPGHGSRHRMMVGATDQVLAASVTGGDDPLLAAVLPPGVLGIGAGGGPLVRQAWQA